MRSLDITDVLMAICMLLFVVGLLLIAYVIWDAIYRTFFVNYAEWHTYEARVAEREKVEASTTYIPTIVGKTTVINMIHNPEEYIVWVELTRGSYPQSADEANLLFGWLHDIRDEELYEAVKEGDTIEVLARVGYSKLSGEAKCVDVELPDS